LLTQRQQEGFCNGVYLYLYFINLFLHHLWWLDALVGVMGVQGGTCLNSIIVHPNWCIRGCWFTLPNSTIVCPMSFTPKSVGLYFTKLKWKGGPSHIIGLVVYLTSLKNSANQSDPLEKKKWKKNIELWDALTTNDYKLCIIYL
jgi:hypothetical protein